MTVEPRSRTTYVKPRATGALVALSGFLPLIGHKFESDARIALALLDHVSTVRCGNPPGGVIVEVREKCVRSMRDVILRHHNLCAQGQELPIHLGPADDPRLLLVRHGAERLVDGMNDLHAVPCERGVAREHDVAPVLERAAAREALQGLASHDDGMALRAAHEMTHVGTVRHEHVTVAADAPVVAHRHDRLESTLQWGFPSPAARSGSSRR